MGDTLGGLLLDFSLRYPQFSLQDIFDITASIAELQEIEGGFDYRKRAPITRLKIFWELVTSPLPIRTSDLAQSIREPGSIIGRHLTSLSEKGLLLYEVVAYGEPKTYFRLKEKQPPYTPQTVGTETLLTQSIYQILQQNPNQNLTIESIREAYLSIHPESMKLPKIRLEARLSGILSAFAKQGYVERGMFGAEKQSEVNLNDEQRQMILDLVILLDQFQNQEPEILAYGRKCMLEITADPEKVSILMRKAREHSYHTRAVPKEQSIATILTIISQHLDLTITQIREMLTHQQDRSLGKRYIRQLLQSLLENGQVRQETVRGVRHFSVTTPTT